VVTALLEAMSQAGGDPHNVRVDLVGAAPVGEFVDIEATARRATASCGGEVIAECRA
jgi:hypothetical protein